MSGQGDPARSANLPAWSERFGISARFRLPPLIGKEPLSETPLLAEKTIDTAADQRGSIAWARSRYRDTFTFQTHLILEHREMLAERLERLRLAVHLHPSRGRRQSTFVGRDLRIINQKLEAE